MKKIYLTLVGLVLLHSAGAQDLHFSQTTQTPHLINPAAVGVFDGWERLTINHRNQWLGSSTQFMSTAVAADVNLGKTRMNDKAYLGLGLMFFNDIGGDSNFGNTQGSVTVGFFQWEALDILCPQEYKVDLDNAKETLMQ
jgi:hypothetical protein